MKTITIFTTYLKNNPSLFGTLGETYPIKNHALTSILLNTFDYNIEDIRTIWAGVSKENMTKAIHEAWDDNNLADNLSEDTSLIDDDDDLLTELWEKQKENILYESNSHGFWSVYPAKNHSGVYALNALSKKRNFKDWTESLVQIAKAIDFEVSTINLVLHDKDVGIDRECHPYSKKELDDEYGGEKCFSEFKTKYRIEKLNVIIFQHNSAFADKLLKNEELKDIHEEISATIKANFFKKLNSTIEELKKKDPIGDSYNIH